MSDFDERWRKLVDAARRAEDAESDAVSSLDSAARIAMIARTQIEHRARIRREWRGLAVAASVFVACLLALAFGAHVLGFESEIGDARHELSHLARRVPDTSFVPPPPRLADLGFPTLAQIGPKLTSCPGANFLTSIDDWFTSRPSNAEISR